MKTIFSIKINTQIHTHMLYKGNWVMTNCVCLVGQLRKNKAFHHFFLTFDN